MTYIKRVWAIALGIVLFISYKPAVALNGYTNVSICNCTTTTNFAAAAKNQSSRLGQGGTYIVVSSSNASTAYMSVTGKYLNYPKDPVWAPVSATPVDSSGNSLVGESEGTLEAYYAATDQVIFGANRSAPTAINEPEDYASSFVGSEEGEVVPGIGQALLQLGINPAEIPIGTVITVKFSDGTTAQYVKQSLTSTYQWLWNGIVHNKTGQLINRSGGLISNANTAGAGGGSFTAPGYGSGSDWSWTVNGNPLCTVAITTVVDGEEFTLGSFFTPC
jgi:hypothetical protein